MKNKLKFLQKITPKGDLLIEIEEKEIISCINTHSFIKKYKISKIFYGKYFLKRLIKKVFKYQIKKKMIWKKNFWEEILIYKLDIDINLFDKDRYSIIKYFNKNINSKRLKDIEKYQQYINKGINVGMPLYITSDCINFLVGDKNLTKNKAFILDGSRRLIANIFNGINPNILVIDLKKNNE